MFADWETVFVCSYYSTLHHSVEFSICMSFLDEIGFPDQAYIEPVQ